MHIQNNARYRLALLIALVGFIALPGCATITEGSSQTIQIDTDPTGAQCELTRNGQLVTRIPATPSTVSVYKESGDLKLSCGKPGYLDATLDTASDLQAMVFGNILFGGLIGVAIDMGSGANKKYPKAITLTLVPELFASAAERDEYFDRLRQRLNQRAEAQMDKVRQSCEASSCDEQLAGVRSALERQLDFLDSQKAAVKIAH